MSSKTNSRFQISTQRNYSHTGKIFKQGVKRPKTLKIRTKSLHTGGELTVVVHTNLPYYRGALNYTHPYFLPCDMTRK